MSATTIDRRQLRNMTIEERVALGARELDVRDPEWFWKVRPGKLRLDDACNCVLGQLEAVATGSRTGWYSGGARLLFRRPPWQISVFLAKRGFVESMTEDGAYPQMTTAWRREIRARRKAARS